MTRRWPVLLLLSLLVAACGGADQDAGDDGALIAVNEGEPVTRTLASPNRTSWDSAPWARVDGDQLILEPPCNTVPGTSGPPQLFVLDEADGGEAFVVQVRPSLAGPCLPRVLACIQEPDGTCASYLDQSTGQDHDERIPIAFCYGASCQPADLVDQVIELVLLNPDDRDPELVARLTSDAPIHFRGNPLNFSSVIEGDLYDANITGEFRVSYEIARGMSEARRIATGSYRMQWNDALGFGIEGEFCSSPAGCTVRHGPTRSVDGSACMVTATGPVSLGLRIWIAENADRRDADRLLVLGQLVPGATPLVFHSTSSTSTGSIELPLMPGPQTLFVDAGDAVGADVVVRMVACRSGSSPGGMTPLCSAPGAGADARLTVGVSPTLGQCP